MELPVPTDAPPQLPEYHFHEAPSPNEPPVTAKVLGLPEQTEVGFAEAPVGAIDEAVTVTVTLAQVVVLQLPSART